ncbi:MAG TPA: glycosyltransferase family 87 protein [Gemmataceae bacterium]|nr:glycosyltransferase family 87 protein [Gemmataceae bacterium]
MPTSGSVPLHLSPGTCYGTPSRLERLGVVALILVLILFGALVEKRSAFMSRRMTDLDVYLRAAWAVRTGANFYESTDDNGWHYHYPPLFAIALMPLADPPPGYDRTGMLPFAVSVGIWYAFSVLCLFWAIHGLASVLEQNSPDPAVRTMPRGCRRWWALRIWPFLLCLPPIGHSFMRGQVNLLLLLLLAGMAVAVLRGQHRRAGLWLAAAICLKIIPAFLIAYPVWRRDWRCLVSCGTGLVLGLGVIPACLFGPERTIAYYQEWDKALRQPVMSNGDDQSRAKELTEITATDSQSFVAVIHNILNPDRTTRPAHASPFVLMSHWLLGGGLAVLTLAAAGLRGPRSSDSEAMFLGALILVMLLLSPVCHLHYFSLSTVLVMAFLAHSWEGQQTLRLHASWWLLFGGNLLANAIPDLPGMELTRDFGLATFGALLLWMTANRLLWTRDGRQAAPARPWLAVPEVAA